MSSNKNINSLIGLIVIMIVLIVGISILNNKSDSISYQEIVNEESDNYSDMIIVDSNYLVLASITDNVVKSSLIMYDENDEIIWSVNYSYQEYDTYLTEIEIYEDSYIGVGYYNIDEESTGSLIVEFDSSGNVLKESVFSYYVENRYTDILIDDDKIIAVGYSYDFDDYKCIGFIDMYDDELIMIDEEYINDICLNAIEKSDDNYILVGVNDVLGEDKKGSLIIVDLNLDIVDSITYEEQSEFSDVAINDSGYFVIGNVTDEDGNSNALIIKYDYDDNFIWSNVLGGNDVDYYSKIIVTQNDNVLVIGTVYSSDIEANSEGTSRGVIVFYDNGGNIISNDYYGEGDIYYSFYNITEKEDEYYILGMYDNSFGLIVKFSAN